MFKEQYLQGQLNIDDIDDFVHKWHTGAGKGKSLQEYLGLADDEFESFLHGDDELKKLLDAQKIKSVASYSSRIAEQCNDKK